MTLFRRDRPVGGRGAAGIRMVAAGLPRAANRGRRGLAKAVGVNKGEMRARRRGPQATLGHHAGRFSKPGPSPTWLNVGRQRAWICVMRHDAMQSRCGRWRSGMETHARGQPPPRLAERREAERREA